MSKSTADQKRSLGERATSFFSSGVGMATAVVGVAAIGVGTFAAMRYHVCLPHERLVRTGLGITGMKTSMQGVRWPFQKVIRVDITPTTHHMMLNNMSQERVAFRMPISLNLRPINPDKSLAGFENYVRQIAPFGREKQKEIIEGISHGELRILTANMKIDDLVQNRQKIREDLSTAINKDLEQVGLELVTVNIEEMTDTEGNTYFQHQKQKALEGAINKAKVDVAEAKSAGMIGAQEKETKAQKETARMIADGKVEVNAQNQRIAKSDMEYKVAAADFERRSAIALVEAHAAKEQKEAELMQAVEQKRREQKVESLRATDLAAATVKAESDIKNAEGAARVMMQQADAQKYRTIAAAEALRKEKEQAADAVKYEQSAVAVGEAEALERMAAAERLKAIKEAEGKAESLERMASAERLNAIKIAEGQAEATRLLAEANLVRDMKTAEGLRAVKQAEADGLRYEYEAFGKNDFVFIQHMLARTGVYNKFAEEGSKAFQGMGIKLNVMAGSGQGSGVGTAVSDVTRDLVKGMPMLMDFLKQSTGVDVVDYLRGKTVPSATPALPSS